MGFLLFIVILYLGYIRHTLGEILKEIKKK